MKMKFSLYAMALLLCPLFASGTEAEGLPVRITVNSGDVERFDTPVSLVLDDITHVHESQLKLYELTGEDMVPVAAQYSHGEDRRIHWLLQGTTKQGQDRIYLLKKEISGSGTKRISIQEERGSYLMYSDDRPVIRYNSGMAYPPEGADSAYMRSGFIHPLYAPDGTVLTEIQPRDHFHHYGIWNPWTRTTFRGKEVDFWNLAKKEGTVRFAGLTAINEGPVFGSIQVLHEHVAWPGSPGETAAMNELQDIKVFSRNDGSYMIEIISRLSPVEELVLEEYRYGGFVMRATSDWTNRNSDFFTSRGFDRDHADGERAEWCVVSGETNSGRAGILFMGHPSNYNHPEPLRIWPSDTGGGEGNHFINFSPTRNTQWALEPGTTYMLRYRMLVFDGDIEKDYATRIWKDFSIPPLIEYEKYHVPPAKNGRWDNRTGNVAGTSMLVYTRVGDGGFVHESTPAAVEALKKLAASHGFSLTVTDKPSVFRDETIEKFDAIVFANTNNDVFDSDDQRLALKRYVQAGGGFVGIHIAVGTERDWDWYKKMIGATFDRHPPYQEFHVARIDGSHPSAKHLPDSWVIADEPYYVKEYNPQVRVILAHDLSTITDKTGKPDIFGRYYPSVWCNDFDGGRQWYTGYGHDDHIYSDSSFLKHILGGISWVIASGPPDYRKAYSISIND